MRAVFHSDHIDCPPWGDLPGTVALLITGNPEINVCFEYRSGETGYSISTNEIKEIHGRRPTELSEGDVAY
ncbi:hypothetical protein NXW71_02110 [Parabacteroides merdae]|nr:hypothetical protein [Parabacteroides merdae]